MKKITLVLALVIATMVNANAMSYTKARSEALFLTDKMAYELDLTNYQYEAVYEINLDYFNGLIGNTDPFGINWSRRANELGYLLTNWQYRRFLETEYFYRPVIVRNNVLAFVVYDRYHRDRFYKPAPKAHANYHPGTRKYHEAPHNNKHFAENHHHGKNNGHKPEAVNPNHGGHNKPEAVKPNHGGHNKPEGVKPNNGGNNKPAGNHNTGNANKGTKPSGNTHGTVNTGSRNTERNASRNTAERRSTSKTANGSSNGRRSK